MCRLVFLGAVECAPVSLGVGDSLLCEVTAAMLASIRGSVGVGGVAVNH